MLNSKRGFSLVELLVFVSILSIFFIMAASVVTVSLKNMKFNENKIRATHYAGQVSEWLRAQKEVNWGGEYCNGCASPVSFTEMASASGNQTTYCFNTNPIDNWQSSGECPDFGLDSLFKREILFTMTPTGGYVGEVSSTITVSWLDLGQERSIVTNTTYTVLE